MNLQTLTERAANSEVRELELLSLEGGFYLARIRMVQGLGSHGLLGALAP